MLIYQIIHIESGYRYIGQTTRPFCKRRHEHRYALRHGTHGNRHLQAAWDKYGEDAFRFEVIRECASLEELNEKEVELIKNNNDLYNLTVGGNSFQHNGKAKRKIGEANKIPIVGMNIKTQEIRYYDSAADTKADGFDEKCVRKCVTGFISKRGDGTAFHSISHKGWVWMSKQEATESKLKEKCDIAKRGKVRFERPVLGMNVFTGKLLKFRSASEAGRNGFNLTTVHKACNTFSCVHKGFVWVYADTMSPESLLRDKKKHVLSATRTGPKSWSK